MSKLAASGLSGKAAVDCCTRAGDAYQLRLRGIFGDLLTRVVDAQSRETFDSQIALVPGVPKKFPPLRTPPRPPPTPLPRIVTITRGRPLAVGAIVLLSAQALSTLVRQLATLEALTAVLVALDEVSTATDCESCVRDHLWRQTKPQFRETLEVRKRL